MFRKLSIFLLVFPLVSCAQLQQVVKNLPQVQQTPTVDIASGLREALTTGIDKQVSKLTQKDGFFKNELVRIGLPEDLRKVDKALRKIGLSSLADEGLKALNRAAENAVNEATPVFISAVKDIKFDDAKTILLGNNSAATEYLTTKTETALYQKFNPVIKQSFSKVGADKIWANLINKYNTAMTLTGGEKINPDLEEYITERAIDGLFIMVEKEENKIRLDPMARVSDLLSKVFGSLTN